MHILRFGVHKLYDIRSTAPCAYDICNNEYIICFIARNFNCSDNVDKVYYLSKRWQFYAELAIEIGHSNEQRKFIIFLCATCIGMQ